MRHRGKAAGWKPDIELAWLSSEAANQGDRCHESVDAFREYGRNQRTILTVDLENIDRLVLSTHPLPLLACFSTFFLTSLLPSKKIDEDVPIGQADGEILQAVLLRHALDEFVWREHPSGAIDPIGRCLHSLNRAFSAQRLAQVAPGDEIEQSARQFITEIVRGNTQLARNWGYSYQTFRVVEDLLEPLAADLIRICGATASDMLSFWTSITKTTEDRLTATLESIRKARCEPSWERFLRRVATEHAIPRRHIDRIRSTINCSEKTVATEAAFFLVLEILLPGTYLFRWNQLREICPSTVADEALLTLLERWSISFGDLANTPIEHYFLNNPVWRRPLIRLDRQTWFIPLPHLFFSFCWELLCDLLREDEAAFARYSRRRAVYLEQTVAAEFAVAFPMATVFAGNMWTDPSDGKEYENDILIRIDAFLFVIEAKAGMVHETARRGAPGRLEQVIKDLIIAPAKQSKRFEVFLRTQTGVVRFRAKDRAPREIDMAGVRHVVSYAITLDIAGDLSAAQSELRKTGWIPEDIVLPPSMTLSDLQNIFELLEGYCPKLHYLLRRAQLERHTRFFADELDLLAMYLDKQFEFGAAELDGTWIIAYGSSAVFEKYFSEKEQGRQPRKPQLKLSRWWSNILDAFDRRLPKMWSILGTDLLSVPAHDQVRFAGLMRQAQQHVLAGNADRGDRVLMVTGHKQRRIAIAGVCYVDRTRDERNARLLEAARQVACADGTLPDRVVVLGRDPRLQGDPYSVVLLVEFGQENDALPA